MTEPFVTFVIPTLGRSKIARALATLEAQDDRRWRAILALDGAELPPLPHFRSWDQVEVVPLPKQPGEWGLAAARTRNAVLGRVTTEWIAFLDDDDALRGDYVSTLAALAALPETYDVVVFRAARRGEELPPRDLAPGAWSGLATPRRPRPPWLQFGKVTIAFAVRTAFMVPFSTELIGDRSASGEDFLFLADAWDRRQGRFYLTDAVHYFIWMPSDGR